MTTLSEKASLIKLLLLDVDGVLTDGTIFYSDNGCKMRQFHVHDGMGIRLLQQAGIQVGVISAKTSSCVRERLENLNIKHIFLGEEDKILCYQNIKTQLQLKDCQIAYMGDDILDLPVLQRAGLTITTPHAASYVKDAVDITTTKDAGKGAVRELCEFILTSQDKLEDIIQSYLTTIDRVS